MSNLVSESGKDISLLGDGIEFSSLDSVSIQVEPLQMCSYCVRMRDERGEEWMKWEDRLIDQPMNGMKPV